MDIIIKKAQKGRKHRVIGIDLGTKDLATLSNGVKIKEHESLPRLRHNLFKLQLKQERQEKNSGKWCETTRIINRTQQRISQAETDHAQKLSKFLTNSYRIICIEGPSANEKHPNQNWEIIRTVLKKKCQQSGITYIEVSPYLTTQTCSRCGNLQKIPKEERTYKCPKCGLSLDRDVLAAINIRKKGLDKFTR